MLGFLVQWPTVITLVMFPILVVVDVRLAGREERDVRGMWKISKLYDQYVEKTPAFVPWLGERLPRSAKYPQPHDARVSAIVGLSVLRTRRVLAAIMSGYGGPLSAA